MNLTLILLRCLGVKSIHPKILEQENVHEGLENTIDDSQFDDITDFNIDSPSTPPPEIKPLKTVGKPLNNKKKFKEENDLKPEEMFEIIDSKVGSFRFKCSVCSHKSRYKQGIIGKIL